MTDHEHDFGRYNQLNDFCEVQGCMVSAWDLLPRLRVALRDLVSLAEDELGSEESCFDCGIDGEPCAGHARLRDARVVNQR